MESIEIFVVDIYWKSSKNHDYSYFKKLESAKRRANYYLHMYDNIIIRIYPSHLVID